MTVASLVLSIGAAWAQNVKVSGTVTDGTGEPLIGVYVLVEGTTTGASTDIDGKYTLNAPANANLVFSLMGMQNSVVPVNNRSVINVVMQEDAVLLSDVVVVGFGTQKKENLTGAVASVDVNKVFNSKPIADVSKGLQGVVPGMTITYSTNDMGAPASIKVRGTGSINGSNKPLILLDGVEIEDLSFVNPDNIANISVLKDAASSSIYGARAAYGVVLITSKSGSEMKDNVRITYSNNFSWNQPINLPKYITDERIIDQLELTMQAKKAQNGADFEAFGMYFKDLVEPISDWLNKYHGQDLGELMVYGRDYTYTAAGTPQFYRVWDPNESILKKSSFQQNHNLTVSGNTGKTNYNISAAYNYQDGLMKAAKEQNLQRINANVSTNTQVYKWLNIGTKLMYTEKVQKYPYGYDSSESSGGLYAYSMRFFPFFPYGISDGAKDPATGEYLNASTQSGEGLYFRHGNGFIAYAPVATSEDEYLRLGINAKVDITKNLSVYADYTRGQHNYLNKTIQQPQYVANYWSSWSPKAAYTSGDQISHTWLKKTSNTFNAYVDYHLNIKDEHHFDFKVGMNTEDLTYNSNSLTSKNLINPDLPTMNQTYGKSEATVNEVLKDRATAGFFARINYNYKGIYLVELNGRYDGSSQFKAGEKWAFFPSFSLGYRISEEKFFEPAKKVISNLKIRGSYGSVGNQDIGSDWYPFIATIGTGSANWVLPGGTLANGTGMPSIIGAAMTWEQIRTLDLGFDIGFLKNELTATFDWYQRRNIGMLVPRNAISAIGGISTLPKENSGDLTTNGWELQINYNHIFDNNLSIYATATLADSKSKISKWNTSTGLLTGNYEGKELGEIWGFKTSGGNGYFTADEVINGVQTAAGIKTIKEYQGNLQSGNFVYGEGDVKYQDLDGDGNVNSGEGTINDHGDLIRIGNTLPRYEYSLRAGLAWKGFDFEVLFQGVGKRNMWSYSSTILPFTEENQSNIFEYQLDMYSSDNPNAKFPRPYMGHTGKSVNGQTGTGCNNYYPQTKYLVNLAYLRFKNLTLGYTLPEALTTKAFIQKARVYISIENLATFDHLDGAMDPELTGGWSTGGASSGSALDAHYTGRATPFTRMWSCGLQITF